MADNEIEFVQNNFMVLIFSSKYSDWQILCNSIEASASPKAFALPKYARAMFINMLYFCLSEKHTISHDWLVSPLKHNENKENERIHY